MTSLFDKNGNATETHIATVSGCAPETGEHLSTYDVRILAGTGIPGSSTLQLAPEVKSGYAACWNGVEWQEIVDLRGSTVYEKATGVSFTVKDLSELDDTYTSKVPVTPYDKWNGTEWVTDVDAQRHALVATAEIERTALLSEADNVMRDWRDELALGLISDEDKAKLTIWLEYKKQVKAVDITTAYRWPTPPAQ